jgi:hypothetical protein
MVAALRAGRIRALRGLAGFDELQAPVEIAGLDGPDEGDDDLGDLARLARRDDALGERRRDRPHRPGDIGGAGDPRHRELYRTVTGQIITLSFASRRTLEIT